MGFSGIVIVDVDAHVPLAERIDYAKAQDAQIREDIAPAWGLAPLSVRAATPDALPRPGEIQIRLLNKPTLDGAIGYHDTTDDGTPIAYVFVALAKSLGDAWTSVSSHEVGELAVDPYLRRSVQMDDGFWDMEICDRVEQDSYSKGGVSLSNFNTPACFEPATKRVTGVKYDFLGLSSRPNEVRPGGYAQRFDPSKGWVQIGQMSDYRVEMAFLKISRGAKRRATTRKRNILSRLFRR